jgi:hypothetical protein
MPSTTLKRTAATVGVLAGLLAAAAPASAQILDGPVLWDTPRNQESPHASRILSLELENALVSGWEFTQVRNLNDVEAIDVSYNPVGFSRGGHLAYTSFDAKSGKEGLYLKQSLLDAHMEI